MPVWPQVHFVIKSQFFVLLYMVVLFFLDLTISHTLGLAWLILYHRCYILYHSGKDHLKFFSSKHLIEWSFAEKLRLEHEYWLGDGCFYIGNQQRFEKKNRSDNLSFLFLYHASRERKTIPLPNEKKIKTFLIYISLRINSTPNRNPTLPPEIKIWTNSNLH